MSVTPLLHPFVKVSSSSSCDADPSNPTIDADRTLYDFLTPKIGEKTISSSTAVEELMSTEDVSKMEDGDRCAFDKGSKGLESDCSASRAAVVVEKLTLTADDRQLPEWYSRCEHVSVLLRRADGLNWLEDSFTAIPIPVPPIKISAINLVNASSDSQLVHAHSKTSQMTRTDTVINSSTRSLSSKSSRDDADYSDSCGDDESGSGCTDGESQPYKVRFADPLSVVVYAMICFMVFSNRSIDPDQELAPSTTLIRIPQDHHHLGSTSLGHSLAVDNHRSPRLPPRTCSRHRLKITKRDERYLMFVSYIVVS